MLAYLRADGARYSGVEHAAQALRRPLRRLDFQVGQQRFKVLQEGCRRQGNPLTAQEGNSNRSNVASSTTSSMTSARATSRGRALQDQEHCGS